MGKCKANQLGDAIAKELSGYSQDVTDGIKKSIKTVSEECRDDIRKNSPRLTGNYAKGWAKKVGYEVKDAIRMIVYNKTDYQIAHLLEHGHAKAGGGRVEAVPHIRPACEKAEEYLGKEVKVVVKG